MKKVTMVVPTYNDIDSLSQLIKLIDHQKTPELMYLIVDNGSSIAGIRELLSDTSEFWAAIHLNQNIGFGGGILAGIEAADTDWVGWMPGNLKILPENVETLVRGISLNPNLFVKCHRKRKSRIARFKTFIAGFIQSLLTGRNLFDTGGTPTICERSFVRRLQALPTDFVLESRMLYEARANKLEVVRPFIPYGERLYGQSHWQRGIKSEYRLMKAIILDSLKSRNRSRKSR